MTHSDLLKLADADAKPPASCSTCVKRLGMCWETTCTGRLVRVIVFRCSNCNATIEVTVDETNAQQPRLVHRRSQS